MCDRVGVLYAGELVEEGPAKALFDDPRHPYTVGLLRCIPRGGSGRIRGASTRSPASCRRRAPTSPAACSPTAARSPTTAAAPSRRRRPDLGGRSTRCFYHERAQTSRAQTPEDLPRSRAILDRAPCSAPGGLEDVPAGGQPNPRALGRLRRGLAGRDARPRGRVGKREDDVRTRPTRDHEAGCRLRARPRRPTRCRARRESARETTSVRSRSSSRTPISAEPAARGAAHRRTRARRGWQACAGASATTVWSR